MRFEHVSGFTLIEVVISLCLVSFMLLVMNRGVYVAMGETHQLSYASIASRQINDLYVCMRIHSGRCPRESTWKMTTSSLLPSGYAFINAEENFSVIEVGWKNHKLIRVVYE